MEVAGIEPAGAGGSTPANKRVSVYSPEALIKILTNLTDADRQMLSQIVERWGDLSDELKRAVLRVVVLDPVLEMDRNGLLDFAEEGTVDYK